MLVSGGCVTAGVAGRRRKSGVVFDTSFAESTLPAPVPASRGATRARRAVHRAWPEAGGERVYGDNNARRCVGASTKSPDLLVNWTRHRLRFVPTIRRETGVGRPRTQPPAGVLPGPPRNPMPGPEAGRAARHRPPRAVGTRTALVVGPTSGTSERRSPPNHQAGNRLAPAESAAGRFRPRCESL